MSQISTGVQISDGLPSSRKDIWRVWRDHLPAHPSFSGSVICIPHTKTYNEEQRVENQKEQLSRTQWCSGTRKSSVECISQMGQGRTYEIVCRFGCWKEDTPNTEDCIKPKLISFSSKRSRVGVPSMAGVKRPRLAACTEFKEILAVTTLEQTERNQQWKANSFFIKMCSWSAKYQFHSPAYRPKFNSTTVRMGVLPKSS